MLPDGFKSSRRSAHRDRYDAGGCGPAQSIDMVHSHPEQANRPGLNGHSARDDRMLRDGRMVSNQAALHLEPSSRLRKVDGALDRPASTLFDVTASPGVIHVP
jgi:hypothetical protein